MRTLLSLILLIAAPVVLSSHDAQAAAVAAAPGEILGRVVDANRQPVARAHVQVELTLRSGRTITETTVTDARGRFRFGRVPESRGVIRAGKRGVGVDRERIGVRSGATVRIGLQLQ